MTQPETNNSSAQKPTGGACVKSWVGTVSNPGIGSRPNNVIGAINAVDVVFNPPQGGNPNAGGQN
ncbi:Protein of unknown function [Pyronema omphalodes CBS 100304]|uniref:Uncharacterized protein n=1 Tax=Pyronema omphalodes (strain CBS 100304) TaxID=1076935 RepID=U4LBA7_PYROM|nr:Protein of unknown function [Pyronema omphalodes CBS 100304]